MINKQNAALSLNSDSIDMMNVLLSYGDIFCHGNNPMMRGRSYYFYITFSTAIAHSYNVFAVGGSDYDMDIAMGNLYEYFCIKLFSEIETMERNDE